MVPRLSISSCRAHADAVVGDQQGARLLVRHDADLGLGGRRERAVGQRLEPAPVHRIGGVGHQLAQEYLPLGIERVHHEIEQPPDLGAEIMLFLHHIVHRQSSCRAAICGRKRAVSMRRRAGQQGGAHRVHRERHTEGPDGDRVNANLGYPEVRPRQTLRAKRILLPRWPSVHTSVTRLDPAFPAGTTPEPIPPEALAFRSATPKHPAMFGFDTGFAPRVKAVLGPTNTGKTHLAIERMLAHASGIIGFPLRLLARENYDRMVAQKGARHVALITGEEKIVPPDARWFSCTVEAMPLDRDAEFLAVDEIQLCADPDRGHVFTDRLLHARGLVETMFLGAETIRPLLQRLVPQASVETRPRMSQLSHAGPVEAGPPAAALRRGGVQRRPMSTRSPN